jgi:lipid II:glycine glycyltransferase (peptidoglycan interpeptide bridge formation enzyme)
MVAEVKSLAAEVEKEIKSFEKGVEDVGSAFTDVAHINLAKVHLGEILSQLRGRRENVEAEQAATAAAAPVAPADLVDQNTKTELQAAAADAGVAVAASATKTEIATAIVEQAPDPAAGLVELPAAPEQPAV